MVADLSLHDNQSQHIKIESPETVSLHYDNKKVNTTSLLDDYFRVESHLHDLDPRFVQQFEPFFAVVDGTSHEPQRED